LHRNFTPPRLEADLTHPATNAEFASIKKPLPSPSLKGLSFILQRAALGTTGRLSQGIRIGHATGFDSGESLDYVYENKPRGNLLVGKVIDYFYLNAIGWRGIRQRRACMNQALRFALEANPRGWHALAAHGHRRRSWALLARCARRARFENSVP
jgi:hypothetical protein